MAGDWIKLRTDLQSHPKVVRILSATESDKFRVIGGLHAVWSVFDAHTTDGRLTGYTPELMDHIIGWTGFSAAMMAVGWLHQEGEETLILPEFDEHNGRSGKRRAEDQKRKRDTRRTSANSPNEVRTECGQKADSREEREKNKDNPPIAPPNRFDDFWNAYPKKTGKAPCVDKWKRKHLDEKADEILAKLEQQKTLDADWIDGFIPNPLTYLNQSRWEDEIQQRRNNHAAGSANRRESVSERVTRVNAERAAEIEREFDQGAAPDDETLALDGEVLRAQVG